MKKILITLCLALLLFPSLTLGASNLSFGAECKTDSECASGDCESANSNDPKINGKSYCDCSSDDNCKNIFQSQYAGLPSSDWECIDGTEKSHDIDYCQNGQTVIYPLPPATVEDSLKNDLINSVKETPLTENELDAMLKKPEPRITIPGLQFSDTSVEKNKVTDSDGTTYLVFPFLGEYLAAIYKYVIVVISIIAVIMLIVSGFQWAIPDASGENISAAKNRIAGALSGLIIAVGSYVILYTVNPELVQFRSLRVQYVAGIDLADYSKYPSDPGVDDAGDVPYGQDTKANLDNNSINAAKGQGCGKNLVAIAEAFSGQTICQGPCHCANFVSRVLVQSGCGKEYTSDSAPNLKAKLLKLGWELHDGVEGVEPGDVVFWGKSGERPPHVEIAYNSSGFSIGSSVNMTACWQGKAKEIQNSCGEFWQLGYYGGEKKAGIAQKYGYSGSKDEVKQQYSACVAKFNVCPPWGGDRPDLCGYCAKIGPADQFHKPSSCVSRQCIQVTKGKRWGYYLKNPNNN